MAKKRILIVDDLAIYREPISLALEAEGYKTFVAEDGRDAIRVVESSTQPFDLMIVDYSMPEMNGLQFIHQAKTYAHMQHVPSIMLTDMADKVIVVNALKEGVRDYMLKSAFSLSALLEKVHSVIESHRKQVDPVPHRQEEPAVRHVSDTVKVKIKKYIAGNPIPAATQDLLVSVQDEGADTAELANIISTDPALASKILKAANSSMFLRINRQITNLEEAIAIVGFSAIKNIAASTWLHNNSADSLHLSSLSRHTYCVAHLMRYLWSDSEFAHTAQVVGLCHDLPIFIISQLFPEEFKRSVHAGEAAEFQRRIAGELQMPYIDIVDFVLHEFGLPTQVTEPIHNYHAAQFSHGDIFSRIAASLAIIHPYANAMGFGTPVDNALTAFPAAFVHSALGDRVSRLSFPISTSKEINESCAGLGFVPLDVDSEGSLARVCYYRDVSLYGKDPIHHWLELNSSLLVSDELSALIRFSPCTCIIAVAKRLDAALFSSLEQLLKQANTHNIPISVLYLDEAKTTALPDIRAFQLPISIHTLESEVAGAKGNKKAK